MPAERWRCAEWANCFVQGPPGLGSTRLPAEWVLAVDCPPDVATAEERRLQPAFAG
jgi:hypothetical protein